MGLKEGSSFFGYQDRHWNRKARQEEIISSFPAWYFRNHIREIERKIDQCSHILNGDPNIYSTEAKTIARYEKEKYKSQLEAIMEGKPKFSQLGVKSRDYLAKFYQWAGKVIGDEMPTRSEMMGGSSGKYVFDVHEHLKREEEKRLAIIDYADIARACNRQIVKDKISLKDLQVMWKIVGRLLDEQTNVEVLRRDEVGRIGYKDRPIDELDTTPR